MTTPPSARDRLIDAAWVLREARLSAVVLSIDPLPGALVVDAPASIAAEWIERVRPHTDANDQLKMRLGYDESGNCVTGNCVKSSVRAVMRQARHRQTLPSLHAVNAACWVIWSSV